MGNGYVVVVRGYNGIEDAQVVSRHRTEGAAERAKSREVSRVIRTRSAAGYNARYNVEPE